MGRIDKVGSGETFHRDPGGLVRTLRIDCRCECLNITRLT
jgi:hypothetical protein